VHGLGTWWWQAALPCCCYSTRQPCGICFRGQASAVRGCAQPQAPHTAQPHTLSHLVQLAERCAAGCCAQVEAVAVAKHGSLAAVAEEKQRRVRGKIEGRARRRAAEQQAEQVAAEVAARVQAAVGRHSTPSAGRQAQEEGGWAQPSAACLLFQGCCSGLGLLVHLLFKLAISSRGHWPC
jgi:hypothetical protein